MNASIDVPHYEVMTYRDDFPILSTQVHGHPLAYLDNAASTQKPQAVIDAISNFYRGDYANVHRGVHYLSERATDAYEHARRTVAQHINAASEAEVIFVRGATEGINLVAASFGGYFFEPGDEIILSQLEHHANIVPWQMIAEQTGAVLRVVPITDTGEVTLTDYQACFNDQTKFVAISHVSNALGTINPIAEMIAFAHARDVPVFVDGAQAMPHMAIDVQALDCDFYVASAHKCYGPTGIGLLYGKQEWLGHMPPYQGGGDMIRTVSFEKTTYNDLPYKFEAGTPNIAGAVGFAAALEYLQHIGLAAISAHEAALLQYATEALQTISGLRIIGQAPHKAAVISFTVEGVHSHDLGTILDRCGLAVRSGHHCAMPVMRRFGVPATTRASFGLYNTTGEIDRLVAALHEAKKVMLA